MIGKSFWALRRKRTGTFEPMLYKSAAAAQAKADQNGMFDVVPLTAAPVREEGEAVRRAIIDFDVEEYVDGYEFRSDDEGGYMPTEDERELITDAIHGVLSELSLATREEAPERRDCDDCGFKGTSDDASKEQDYCTACGGNSQAGGPDECAHCGAKNHMVMACPKCGGRFSLDEDAREEAPAPTCQRCGGEIAGWCCQNCPAEFREDAQPVADEVLPVAWVIRTKDGHIRMWTVNETRAKTAAEAWGMEARQEGLSPIIHPAPDALRDAERYRYLRSRDPGSDGALPPAGLFIGRVPDNVILTEGDADAAIDQALAALQAEQKGGAA